MTTLAFMPSSLNNAGTISRDLFCSSTEKKEILFVEIKHVPFVNYKSKCLDNNKEILEVCFKETCYIKSIPITDYLSNKEKK